MFSPRLALEKKIVYDHSQLDLSLTEEQQGLNDIFNQVQAKAVAAEATLKDHTAAILHKTSKYLQGIEKKMLRGEKKKFDAEIRQLTKLKAQLFPHDSLQERVFNFMPYYAKWGFEFVLAIKESSPPLAEKLVILVEET
jgi:uncharacterized protein YllA (UPF0747 family)